MTKCNQAQAVPGSVSFKYMPYLLFSPKQCSEVHTLITPVLRRAIPRPRKVEQQIRRRADVRHLRAETEYVL